MPQTVLQSCSVRSDILVLVTDPAIAQSLPTYDGTLAKPVTTFANGNGASQAQTFYASLGRTLTGSASETLRFDNASLVDVLNNAISLTKINAVEIIANPGNTGSVTVGNAASNPFLGPLGGTTPTVTLNPGDRLLWCNAVAGWAVSATNGNIKVLNNASANSNSYDIRVLGS